jgi:hypothetical protein
MSREQVMNYTKQDLDRACAVILERAGIEAENVKDMQKALSRPVLCKYAAEEAFKNTFPQGAKSPNVDVHHACNILRTALKDLDDGQFQFQQFQRSQKKLKVQ